MEYQTYLKNCKCPMEGIIIYNGKALCRWCRMPYSRAGVMQYNDEHFGQQQLKDWEITEVRYEGSLYKKQPEKDPLSLVMVDQMYENGADIYSVYRPSDKEAFRVWDEITWTQYKFTVPFHIKEFFVQNGEMMVRYRQNYDKNNTGVWSFRHIMKNNIGRQPKKWLIADDGVAVYEGDEYWLLNTETWEFSLCKTLFTNRTIFKAFSTEAAANEYVLRNKPCLSANDIIHHEPELGTIYHGRLLELAKQKLK